MAKGLVCRRSADKRHVVVECYAYRLGKEFLRREGTFEHELVVFVAQTYVEACGRLTQAGGKQGLYLAHHAFLESEQVVHADARFVRLAQTLGCSAQVAREVLVHVMGVARASRLGHGFLGNHAVLLCETPKHVPLSAIANGVGEQKRHQPSVKRLVKRVEDVLQEPIALFEFVEVKWIGLTQLEGLEVVFLYGSVTEGIETGKHPAATGSLLVAAISLRYLHVEGLDSVCGNCLRHARHLPKALGGDGVSCHDVGAACAKSFVVLSNVVERDGYGFVHAVLLVCLSSRDECSPYTIYNLLRTQSDESVNIKNEGRGAHDLC